MEQNPGRIRRQLLSGFIKQQLRTLTILIARVLAFVAVPTLFFEIFDRVFGWSKGESFKWGVIIAIVMILVVYGAGIGRALSQLVKDPSQLYGQIFEERSVSREILSRIYGLEKVSSEEVCNVHPDGTFDAIYKDVIRAIAPNIRALEIYGELLVPGTHAGLDIDIPAISVTPAGYPIHTIEQDPERPELHVVRFRDPLPTTESITLAYAMSSSQRAFATSREQYPVGLSFDYSARAARYPTRSLKKEIIFEAGYPLSDVEEARVVVWYGDALVEHDGENRRLSEENCYAFRARRAILNVSEPVLGLTYAVKWTVS